MSTVTDEHGIVRNGKGPRGGQFAAHPHQETPAGMSTLEAPSPDTSPLTTLDTAGEAATVLPGHDRAEHDRAMKLCEAQIHRTALWADEPPMFSEEADDEVECYRCGATIPSVETEAHWVANHHAPAPFAPDSATAIRKEFERWALQNRNLVAQATHILQNDLGHFVHEDALTQVAHTWWLARNGHGSGFTDLADSRPEARQVMAALDEATPTREIELYYGEDGMINAIV